MKRTVPIILVCLVTTGAIGYGGYRYWLLTQENQKLTKQVNNLKARMSKAAFQHDRATETLIELESEIENFSDGSTNWSEIVPEVQRLASELQPELDDIESALTQPNPFETPNPFKTQNPFKQPDYFDTSLP